MKLQGYPVIQHSAISPLEIVCDFDGTISYVDVIDTLLEEFGRPGWKELEQRWEDGEIGSRECLSGQIALLDMSLSELNAALDLITIDPRFGAFTRWAESQGIPLHIVSDGLDYAIERILANNAIVKLPIIANHLAPIDRRHWNITFPHFSPDCLRASGTCKCRAARNLNTHAFLAIGDGRSDFCVASQATYVMAKKSLLTECRKNAIPCTAFNDFDDVRNYIDVTELISLPAAHCGS